MKEHVRSFMLMSEEDEVYTNLHMYDLKKKAFQGEYCIVNDRYSIDLFLSEFLFEYRNSGLKVVNSSSEKFMYALNHYKRFREKDIRKCTDQKIAIEKDIEKTNEFERGIGQFQLQILHGLIVKEIEETDNKKCNTRSGHQIHIGKSEALKWVLSEMENLMRLSV